MGYPGIVGYQRPVAVSQGKERMKYEFYVRHKGYVGTFTALNRRELRQVIADLTIVHEVTEYDILFFPT